MARRRRTHVRAVDTGRRGRRSSSLLGATGRSRRRGRWRRSQSSSYTAGAPIVHGGQSSGSGETGSSRTPGGVAGGAARFRGSARARATRAARRIGSIPLPSVRDCHLRRRQDLTGFRRHPIESLTPRRARQARRGRIAPQAARTPPARAAAMLTASFKRSTGLRRCVEPGTSTACCRRRRTRAFCRRRTAATRPPSVCSSSRS